MALVSFIIPYFNAAKTIDETVDSIYNQSFRDFDIWIVNDGSKDLDSISKLKEYENKPNIHILHITNAGPSVARNIAIKQTSAKYIVPLDADDKITSDAVLQSIQVMESNDKVGVVYGNLRFFGQQNELKIQNIFNPETQFIWNQIAVTVLIKKEVFETIGYYDEALSKLGLEDWEFWIRFGQSDWKAKKIEIEWCEIRVNHDSRTFQVANKNIGAIKEYVYSKHSRYLANTYEKLFYSKKQLLESPDYKIGNYILWPYRMLKKMFN